MNFVLCHTVLNVLLGMLIEHLRNTLYSSPFLILRITGNRMTRDLVICCLLKTTYKTHHFTLIYWQTRGEVLKSTHIPDGSSLHWLLVCMNRSLANFFRKFLGEFGPRLKLNFVFFSANNRSWTPFYSSQNKSWST